MGKTTIAWCDFTFNPWIGCQKVSAGCNNCYAETLMDTRYHRVEWGQRKTDETDPSVGTRVRTSEANWKLPLRWNKKAAAEQEAWERAPICELGEGEDCDSLDTAISRMRMARDDVESVLTALQDKYARENP